MFVVKVTDYAQNTASTGPQSLTINPPALTITAPTLAPGTVNSPYTSSPYTASGGTGPYTFSIASGSLPAGLTLNSASGVLSGTPTTAGPSCSSLKSPIPRRTPPLQAPQSLTINPAGSHHHRAESRPRHCQLALHLQPLHGLRRNRSLYVLHCFRLPPGRLITQLRLRRHLRHPNHGRPFHASS